MPLGGYISIIRVSPYNLPDERRVHMPLKAYYDGSGKGHEDDGVLTLAGFAASEGVWPRFEQKWGEALESLGLPSWHTSEAHYTMTEEEFREASKRLMNVIGSFRTERLWAYSASLLLADYRRAQAEIPALPDPEAICVDGSVGRMGLMDESDLPILLYFDHTEEFLKHVYRIWTTARSRGGEKRGWPWQVEVIAPLDGRKFYPLQAADFFAWQVRRYYYFTHYPESPGADASLAERYGIGTVLFAEHYRRLYDYAAIVSRYSNG